LSHWSPLSLYESYCILEAFEDSEAMDTHPRAKEAHLGTMEAQLGAMKLKLKTCVGSAWSCKKGL
jgi:hypothetical protein